MDNLLEKYIEKLECIATEREYDKAVQELVQTLAEQGYSVQVCQNVKQKGKYIKNVFSDEVNKEKMLSAKENLSDYLKMLLYEEKQTSTGADVEKYIRNFCMFLEALTEKKADRRATLQETVLREIKIQNEYDLQHLLYAVLKPLYPDIRSEVSEDSGVGTIRSDIEIPTLGLILEAKCTREKMNLKKLTEEIEADIVHYQAEQIIFYVYDKEKIVKDKQNYENQFSRMFDGKKVRLIVQQPINI